MSIFYLSIHFYALVSPFLSLPFSLYICMYIYIYIYIYISKQCFTAPGNLSRHLLLVCIHGVPRGGRSIYTYMYILRPPCGTPWMPTKRRGRRWVPYSVKPGLFRAGGARLSWSPDNLREGNSDYEPTGNKRLASLGC